MYNLSEKEGAQHDTEKAVEKGNKAARKAKEALPYGNKKSAVAEAVVEKKAAAAAAQKA